MTGRGGGKASGGDPRGRSRGKTVRVRTAKKRKSSSTRWLQRQLNDPYVAEAKRLGYRSRAAFKLKEIDDKHGLLKGKKVIVDLGAAPGGWTQVAVERCPRDTLIVGLDIREMDAIPGARILMFDFMANDAEARLIAEIGGRSVDLVLSDMASSATGHRQTDHIRTMALCETALDFAIKVLGEGGAFLAKVLRGGTEGELLSRLKVHFLNVKHVKPPSSRSDSSELYVLAMGFKKSSTKKAEK